MTFKIPKDYASRCLGDVDALNIEVPYIKRGHTKTSGKYMYIMSLINVPGKPRQFEKADDGWVLNLDKTKIEVERSDIIYQKPESVCRFYVPSAYIRHCFKLAEKRKNYKKSKSGQESFFEKY